MPIRRDDHAVNRENRERARGALLGLAVGDALGTTLEFQCPPLDRPWRLLDGPHRDVTGGGPFDVVPGQVTDDTQLAVILARSLWARGGFDRDDLVRGYTGWVEHAFDIGTLTSASLARAGLDHEGGRQVWESSGRKAAGNGSLMRTAPIAVYFWNDSSGRRRASLGDSAITHFDPRCQLACAALNAAIATAVASDEPAAALWQAADRELPAAAAAMHKIHPDLVRAIDAAQDDLAADLAAAQQDDPDLWDSIHAAQGFVRVAFRLAFWSLLHAPSFAAGLIDVVNRGGDADTNAAIAGALLGAHRGEQAIPEAWRRRVLEAEPAGGGPLATDYHPRAMMELLAGA